MINKIILISEQLDGKYQVYLNTNLNTILNVPEEIVKEFVIQVWDNAEKKDGRYVKHYNIQEANENG